MESDQRRVVLRAFALEAEAKCWLWRQVLALHLDLDRAMLLADRLKEQRVLCPRAQLVAAGNLLAATAGTIGALDLAVVGQDAEQHPILDSRRQSSRIFKSAPASGPLFRSLVVTLRSTSR